MRDRFRNPVNKVDFQADEEELHFAKAPHSPGTDENAPAADAYMLKPDVQTQYSLVTYHPSRLTNAISSISKNGAAEDLHTEKCFICSDALVAPYMRCAECRPTRLICARCFARGRERQWHHNNHDYIVVRDDINVLPSSGDWTAQEEMTLLNALQKVGYGNWVEVSKALQGKRTPAECRQHYHDCFFGGIFEQRLGLTHAAQSYWPERLPYIMNMRSTEPPRPEENSMQSKLMSGYRCARGDFDTPYDMSAETFLSSINERASDWEEDWSEVGLMLQTALVRAYNNRLRERYRRYRVVRDHGLIAPYRTHAWAKRFVPMFSSESTCQRFMALMQLCKPLEFDKLMESLLMEHEIRTNILRLQELRRFGVRTLAGAEIFYKMREQRKLCQEDAENLCFQQLYDCQKFTQGKLTPDLQGFLDSNNSVPVRKKAGPLDILSMPDYFKLNEAERTLCSVARIFPSNYLKYKELLTAEAAKDGYLRLADARRLIKIDVNKTRQIYDFLVQHGYVKQST